jgi:hypothetical protein
VIGASGEFVVVILKVRDRDGCLEQWIEPIRLDGHDFPAHRRTNRSRDGEFHRGQQVSPNKMIPPVARAPSAPSQSEIPSTLPPSSQG